MLSTSLPYDSSVKKVLSKYFSILEGKEVPSFIRCKEVKVEFSVNESTESLWKKHEKAMKGRCKGSKSLLELKRELTKRIMLSCELCERKYRVNRLAGEKGFCGLGKKSMVASEFIHLGEEPFISPSYTVFFMGCNMSCRYCQNWSISQWYESGTYIPVKIMAKYVELMWKKGVRNLNLEGGEPTPNLYYIISVLQKCDAPIPVVWNSNFYMSIDCMKILDGIVDVYLSDFKYGNDKCARKLSLVENYFEICSRNHLIASKNGEMVIRHLVLPNHIECCSKPVLRWIKNNLDKKCVVNIMSQYRPEFMARNYEEISRPITAEEFQEVVSYATKLGLNFIT